MKTPEEFLQDKGWNKDSNIVGGALWMGIVEMLKEYTELVKNHGVSHHVSNSDYIICQCESENECIGVDCSVIKCKKK